MSDKTIEELKDSFKRAVELAFPRGDDRPERIMAEVDTLIDKVRDEALEEVALKIEESPYGQYVGLTVFVRALKENP